MLLVSPAPAKGSGGTTGADAAAKDGTEAVARTNDAVSGRRTPSPATAAGWDAAATGGWVLVLLALVLVGGCDTPPAPVVAPMAAAARADTKPAALPTT